MQRAIRVSMASLLLTLLLALGVLSVSSTVRGSGTTDNNSVSVQSDSAKHTADSVTNNGASALPYLGISFLPITAQVASYYKLLREQGIYVSDVAPGSPADEAGVEPNSIITRFDGTVLDSKTSIVGLLVKHKAGDSVTLSVVPPNSTSERQVSVVLGSRPGDR